jgi:hypothetical protein
MGVSLSLNSFSFMVLTPFVPGLPAPQAIIPEKQIKERKSAVLMGPPLSMPYDRGSRDGVMLQRKGEG